MQAKRCMVALVLLLGMASGCFQRQEAEKVVESYYDALSRGEVEQAVNMVIPGDDLLFEKTAELQSLIERTGSPQDWMLVAWHMERVSGGVDYDLIYEVEYGPYLFTEKFRVEERDEVFRIRGVQTDYGTYLEDALDEQPIDERPV